MASEAVKFNGTGTLMEMPRMRAMTIQGLCNFLQIGTSTWSDYKSKDGFSDIITRVEGIIFQQKFEGASADLLNPNIIARELGLKEKSEVELKGNLTERFARAEKRTSEE